VGRQVRERGLAGFKSVIVARSIPDKPGKVAHVEINIEKLIEVVIRRLSTNITPRVQFVGAIRGRRRNETPAARELRLLTEGTDQQ
jgi:hypothetical protein